MAEETTTSVACNLPHGLTIDHAEKTVTLNGANHPKAIVTDQTVSGTWGITHGVDKAWIESWMKSTDHQAVANGNIFLNTPGKIADMAEEIGDTMKTGVDRLDPANPGDGVEPVEDQE